MMKHKGMVVVFSAPSGCGKDTVYHELLKRRDDIVESVSATTRLPREGEVEGVNYYFKTEEEFRSLIDNNGLLEYATYNNCYYGTPVEGVQRAINDGKICFLIIEVQGAQRVMNIFPDCVSIFLVPPSLEVLEHRLRKRATDDEEMIVNRLEIAKTELSFQDNYKYRVINDNLEDCVNNIDKILCDELERHNA